MNTLVPFRKTAFTNTIFAVCFACFSFNVTGQTISELVFHNPVLTNGTAGQDFRIIRPTTNFTNIDIPIKLIDFATKYTKPSVSLTWTTTQEHNFSHFIIEHSTDGTNFNQTAVVFGAGESDSKIDYSYADKNMKGRGGIIYYRLKQIAIDGSFTYSSLRKVNLNEDNTSITFSTYPNPVVNDLRVTLPSSWQNKLVNIDLYNVNGQHVNALKVANSSQTESISVTGLQKGVYFVKANCGSEIASQQIIKN